MAIIIIYMYFVLLDGNTIKLFLEQVTKSKQE